MPRMQNDIVSAFLSSLFYLFAGEKERKKNNENKKCIRNGNEFILKNSLLRTMRMCRVVARQRAAKVNGSAESASGRDYSILCTPRREIVVMGLRSHLG